MALPTFDSDRFSAALVRQWQRFGLPDAQAMSADQWWHALSGALAELLADIPRRSRPLADSATLIICRWSFCWAG
ncbi:hypothetical protein E05_01530 [Plautia stali symbiont]|nr:hypothetical protein E05_01530 [Plautia stali symbiont]